MYVKPELQCRGIGSALLGEVSEAIAIGVRSCYCVPYTHLQAFNSLFGFHSVNRGRPPVFLGVAGTSTEREDWMWL